MPSAEHKEGRLRELLGELEGLVVAFSGGVDSTYLVYIAQQVLGNRLHAVTVRSPLHIRTEVEFARDFAAEHGINHHILELHLLGQPDIIANGPDRCYHCKKHILTAVKKVASKLGIRNVADGTNSDDFADYRPGLVACKEEGVIHLLADADLTKEDIRTLSRRHELPTAAKQSSACLASRIPYGTELTPHNLRQIEAAENVLRRLRLSQYRVRHHGNLARIEVPVSEFPLLMSEKTRLEVIEQLTALGFNYITLDLKGYRTGSLNAVLEVGKDE